MITTYIYGFARRKGTWLFTPVNMSYLRLKVRTAITLGIGRLVVPPPDFGTFVIYDAEYFQSKPV